MKLESRFNRGNSLSIIFLIALGWILALPLFKYGVQARLEKQANELSIFLFHAIIGTLIICYMLFKHKVKSVEFRDYQNIVIINCQNTLGHEFSRVIDYRSMTFNEFKTKMHASVDVYSSGRRLFTLYKKDFSDENFLKLISSLNRIKNIEK